MFSFGKTQSDHPLLVKGELARVLSGLRDLPPAKALVEINDWLESLLEDPELASADRFDLLLLLDEAGQSPARALRLEYLAQTRTGHVREQETRELCKSVWLNFSQGYGRCLADVMGQTRGARTLKSRLGLLCAHHMRAMAASAKWAQFSYEQPGPGYWQSLGQTYLLAESAGVLSTSVRLYTNLPFETDCQLEYLKALVFHASSMGTLSPMEIEVSERLIAHVCNQMQLGGQACADNAYWVDPASDGPPMRLMTVPPPDPSVRYIAAGNARVALRQLLERVFDGDSLPDVDFGRPYSPRLLKVALEHLCRAWSLQPPVREHRRHAVRSFMRVVHGLPHIHAHLRGSPMDAADPGNNWQIHNVSLGGMGARLRSDQARGLRVGSLIGMQPEGGRNWLFGKVQRIERRDGGDVHVGIHTLSRSPQPAMAMLGKDKFLALLLDPLHGGEAVRVALPDVHIPPQGVLNILLDGERYNMPPVGSMSHEREFQMCSYLAPQSPMSPMTV